MSVHVLHFCLFLGGQTFLIEREGGQTFFGIGGGDDDVDGGEEEDVNEANIFVSKVSKLSAGARIVRSLCGLEILVTTD